MMRKSRSGSAAEVNGSTALDEEKLQKMIGKDEAFQVFNIVRSSPAYWKTEKSNLMAMIRQLGIPTFFITLSAAETKWLELIAILKKVVDGEDVTEEEAAQIPSADVYRLIHSDAPTCSRYFDRRFRHLKSTWKPPHGPFGNFAMKDYYYRIEFQNRGSPHVHMMAWLKDAPIYDPEKNNESDVCQFVDKIISCKKVGNTEDSVLASLVESRQTHRHSHTCWKKGIRFGVKICRFGIPFFPMDQTRVVHPFLDDD